jgi:hypothetical protein
MHVLSKYFQHLLQSGVGEALDVESVVDVGEEIAVVLLAKMLEDKSQSRGMLFPSSSSSESGARVHAGPEVSLLLLKELLTVSEAVVVLL